MDSNRLIVCGFPRSGTSLLYHMLRTTVVNYQFEDHETRMSDYLDRQGSWCTKRPLDVFYVTDIPKIIVIRDPRAIITSKHPAYEAPYLVDGRTVRRYWRCIRAEIEKPQNRMIRYEDLIADPDAIQASLRDLFLFRGKFSRFHLFDAPEQFAHAMHGVRPLSAPRDWQTHWNRIAEEGPLIAQAVRDMGYAKDDEWLRKALSHFGKRMDSCI